MQLCTFKKTFVGYNFDPWPRPPALLYSSTFLCCVIPSKTQNVIQALGYLGYSLAQGGCKERCF